jgi:hypothetical protein
MQRLQRYQVALEYPHIEEQPIRLLRISLSEWHQEMSDGNVEAIVVSDYCMIGSEAFAYRGQDDQ